MSLLAAEEAESLREEARAHLSRRGGGHRLKKRLVQQAVQQNLELIHGRGPVAALERRRRRRVLVRWSLSAVSLPLVTALGFWGLGLPVPGAFVPAAEELPAGTIGMVLPPIRPEPEGSPAESPTQAAAAVLPASTVPVDSAVFPLAVRHIAIDPGHGGQNLGTHLSGGLSEKEITLDIGQRLAERLREGGFFVTLTRDDDRFVSLRDRAAIANAAGADIFVSIHVNWIADGGSRGVETYFLGTTDDPRLSRLAADENRDSGYSLADMRGLVDRIYSGVRIDKSQGLALSIQSELFRSLKQVNLDLTDRGVKSAPFLVLVDTKMPAILAEVSCLSNRTEADLLTKPLYRQYIADALSLGLMSYARGS
ncbi:MAG TPA: N-acetylmuramoyl-L-alanine amidase [Thermoanaerobaculia bacterium]|nr:N-acetylmuramoyl-L-alanine amidase [Thermoanaerobaculia bacterium]